MTIHGSLENPFFVKKNSVIKFDDDEFCVSTNNGFSGYSFQVSYCEMVGCDNPEVNEYSFESKRSHFVVMIQTSGEVWK